MPSFPIVTIRNQNITSNVLNYPRVRAKRSGTFRFLYEGKGHKGFCYILEIKDDLSGYIRLFPCARANSEQSAEGLAGWSADFEAATTLILDEGFLLKKRGYLDLKEAIYRSPSFYTPVHSVGQRNSGGGKSGGNTGISNVPIGVQDGPNRMAGTA